MRVRRSGRGPGFSVSACFCEHLLPEVKSNGKTIVVVSHDDRYFHVADRVLQMDYGKLTDTRIPKPRKPRAKVA